VGRTEVGHELFGTDPAPSAGTQAVGTGTPTSFVPDGDGTENDGELPNLVDGDDNTSWHTDRYNTPALGGLKPGVGVVLPLDASTTLSSLTVTSPTSGWKLSVYVADRPGQSLDDWGKAVATASPTGDVRLDLHGAEGAAVLLWITNVGPEGRVTLDEVRLRH